MKQIYNHRSFVLIVGFVSILIIIILSTSLDSLDFSKGNTLTPAEIDNNKEYRSSVTPEINWYVIVTVVLLSILVILSLVFGKPKQIPSILPILIPLVIIALVIAWWISGEHTNNEVIQSIRVPTPINTQESPHLNPELVPESINIPQKINPWISFGFSFGLLFSVLLLIWFFWDKHRRNKVPLDNIADIAEQAIKQLQSRKDYENVVIECYANMIVELNNLRSIKRSLDLTPSEFIEVLIQAGVPYDPVQRLTALFERIRYGGKDTSERDIHEATACLSGIVASIREKDEN